MSPEALARAFELYPDVKLIVIAHLYGTPGRMEELKAIADAHGALIVEDAAESLGAKYKLGEQWIETGSWGQYNAISFNGNNRVSTYVRLIGHGECADLMHRRNEIAA